MTQSLPDSLRKQYDAAATSLEKGEILTNYITALQGTPPEQLKVLWLATELQNVILSSEKSKNIQTQHFKEEVRQQEIAAQKAELRFKHRQNMENALIAIGVVTFTLLFLILSRSTITNERLIRFLGILALLLVFEFINLLAHGYLDELTNHSQLVVLLSLVGIASLLIPLHHRLEKWATTKLIEKNKRIRLAAAKVTIEKLEGKVKS